MPRLQSIDPASATGETKALFEGPLKGKELNIFKGMANSPAVLNTYLGIAGALSKASLSAKEQEVIHLAVSQENNCSYCLAAHTAIGKGAGLSDVQTVAARTGSDVGDPKLTALATFAKQLHEKR
ncbi:MAG: carboxymuconolactone decarboxylase family protein, partial [Planctomycetota bacterium]